MAIFGRVRGSANRRFAREIPHGRPTCPGRFGGQICAENARGKSQFGSGWRNWPGKILKNPRRGPSRGRFLAEIADRQIFLDPAVVSPSAGSQTSCKYAAGVFEGGWPKSRGVAANLSPRGGCANPTRGLAFSIFEKSSFRSRNST